MFQPKANIYIVEDEVIIADDLAGSLEEYGYTIEGISDNMLGAFEGIKTSKPDVVLLDIHLNSSSDGIELGKRITEELGIPIIYVSAHIDQKTRLRAEATHPVSFITKPFEPAELNVAIKFAVGKANKFLKNAPSNEEGTDS